MSFVHHLTLGYLEPAAIARASAEVLRELSPEVRALVQRRTEKDSREHEIYRFLIGGQTGTLTPTLVRLPWFSPGVNAESVGLAIELVSLGCIAADVAHARVVTLPELLASLQA